MNWSLFYDLSLFKRLTIDKKINKYVLITDRFINTNLKRLSILNRLYTENEQWLIPAKIYKSGFFKSTMIFNWLYIENKYYRFNIKNKKYVTNVTDHKIIFIKDIKNEILGKIVNHYFNKENKE